MRRLFLLSLMMIFLSGCATAPKASNLNQYTVEKSIIKGKTTKQEVLEKFGAPNIVTKPTTTTGKVTETKFETKDIKMSSTSITTANEIWTYSKSAMNMGGGWASILLLGGFNSNTSIKSVTFMVYFDKNDIAQDYSFTTSQF